MTKVSIAITLLQLAAILRVPHAKEAAAAFHPVAWPTLHAGMYVYGAWAVAMTTCDSVGFADGFLMTNAIVVSSRLFQRVDIEPAVAEVEQTR